MFPVLQVQQFPFERHACGIGGDADLRIECLEQRFIVHGEQPEQAAAEPGEVVGVGEAPGAGRDVAADQRGLWLCDLLEFAAVRVEVVAGVPHAVVHADELVEEAGDVGPRRDVADAQPAAGLQGRQRRFEEAGLVGDVVQGGERDDQVGARGGQLGVFEVDRQYALGGETGRGVELDQLGIGGDEAVQVAAARRQVEDALERAGVDAFEQLPELFIARGGIGAHRGIVFVPANIEDVGVSIHGGAFPVPAATIPLWPGFMSLARPLMLPL